MGSGSVECASGSSVTLSLPLDLVDNSVLRIGRNVYLTLASGTVSQKEEMKRIYCISLGGVCGDNAVINIASGTVFELSGGEMLLGVRTDKGLNIVFFIHNFIVSMIGILHHSRPGRDVGECWCS